jgi:hypothetical protein
MTMTDTELEGRVTATLRAKGEQLHVEQRAFDPEGVALAPLAARGRRRMPVLVAAIVALVVVVAIGAALVLVDRDGSTEPAGEPPSPPAQIQIDALPILSFQSRDFVTTAGPNEITFGDRGGTHELVFEDPRFADFRLDVPPRPGTVQHQVVDLPPGDYRVFCTIPGHRDAGMQAVIHAIDPNATPTKGPVPSPTPTLADGSVDLSRYPDYVLVTSADGRTGYVKREYFRDNGSLLHNAVYGDDLRTVVGHMYVTGFIPLDQDLSERYLQTHR